MSRKTIEELDKNFAATKVEYKGLKFFDVLSEPFKIYGVTPPNDECEYYIRMPQEIADTVNENVSHLCKNPSGARLRFKTTSKRILLKYSGTVYDGNMHLAFTGSSCFDLYVGDQYIKPFMPDVPLKVIGTDSQPEYLESMLHIQGDGLKDITINFPLYNCVKELYIALEEDAKIQAPDEYLPIKPIVIYGSSITQGGCACHAGNSYANIISRRLNCDILNLGFSAGCHAEPQMADYISSLDMSMLVYDYDHNAPTTQELIDNHERFFKIFRKSHPDTPVLIISSVERTFGEKVTAERRAVIKRTYDNAVAAGDKNVYFIDGQSVFADVGYEYCTVDALHPNDLGFWCMANSIGSEIKKILF